MFSFARKNQKLSGVFLLALVICGILFGFLISTRKANAFWPVSGPSIEDRFYNALIAGVNALLYVVMYAAAMIIKWEMQILSWLMSVLDWNNDTIDFSWKITRDVANLFFLLVIIIIAFATVLQIESYGMKQLLPKLIFIALLLNFSLVICGFLIDFSDSFGNTFARAAGGGVTLAASIGSSIQIEKITSSGSAKSDEELTKKISGQGQNASQQSFFAAFLSLIVGIFAALIAVFVFGAAIFFMAVRQFALMIIVILSPMALICLLIPFLNSYWNQWKEAFLKWVTFYPIYMFFTYVALKILQTPSSIASGGNLNSTMEGFSGITSVQAVWKLLITAIFLCGAIMVAQKMSVAGAGAIGSFGKGALKTMAGVGLAKKAYGAVKERVKEEKELQVARLKSKFIPAALAPVAKRKAELKAAGIEKKRAQEFEKTIGLKRDEKGNVVYGIEGVERAAKRFANNPTSRFHKIANQYLEKEIPQRKKTPLTKEDIEKLEESISKK